MPLTTLLVGVVDVGFFGCLILTWLFLWQRRVNGPCQLSLGLLGAAHAAELVQRWPQGLVPANPWIWLWRMAFAFVFVYMMVHIGWLIEAARRHVTGHQRRPQSWPRSMRQPASVTQVASRPGRPRPD